MDLDQDKSLADTIEKTLRYIDAHLDSNLNLSTLAEQSAYSPYHFHRVFYRIVGKTAANYIRERRLSKAAEELVSSDKRILEIAVAFGFSSQESFTRIFKKHYYLTPQRYRRSVRNIIQKRGNKHMNTNATHLPTGWMKAGHSVSSYEIGIDQNTRFKDKPSGCIKTTKSTPGSFGTMMQMFSSSKYNGKRLKLSAYVKSHEVSGWAGIWMRVDGKDNEILSFDNMEQRPIVGTTDWQQVEVVLDVPYDSEAIAFGILLTGNGTVWGNQFHFEVVDRTVPTTNLAEDVQLPPEPVNLDFTL